MSRAVQEQPTAFYDAIAGVYDRWLEGDGAAEDCRAFYLDRLRGTDGAVLELGVGTARIAAPLAAGGRTVVGLDASGAMLARARARGAAGGGTLLLVAARFAALPFVAAFDHVVCPQRTLSYVVEDGELRAVLAGVRRALRAGGEFVFDVDTFDPTWVRQVSGRSHLMHRGPDPGEPGGTVSVWNEYRCDEALRRYRRTVRVERRDGDGRIRSRRAAGAWCRWFDHDELAQAARGAGFLVDGCLGSFSGRPYREGAPRMIWTLRAPQSGHPSARTSPSIDAGSTGQPRRADS